MQRKKLFFGKINAEEGQKNDMLKDDLRNDSVVALKAGNKRMVEILRFLVSLIDKKEMQLEAGKLTETDEIQVLRKELKNKEESKEIFNKAGRGELVAQMDEEIEILKKYLPQDLSENDVTKIVMELKSDGDNFGMLMGKVMGKVKGQVDGAIVTRIVNEVLGK